MNLEFGDQALLGGVIVVCVALVRMVERLMDVAWQRRNGKRSFAPPPAGCHGVSDEAHRAILRLDEMHSKEDEDGVPLWYVPRSMVKTQAKMTEIQDRIAVRLRDVSQMQRETLDRLKH